MKTGKISVVLILGLGLALGWLLAAQPAQAAWMPNSIQVNTTQDQFGTGANCSLREAIQAINTATSFGGCTYTPGDNTIQIIDETYQLSIAGTGEDANATGDLDILAPMTILGSGGSVVNAGSIDRAFQILSSAGSVRIEGVSIRGGSNTGNGGGIFCRAADLTLVDSEVIENTSTSGGGIYIDYGGDLTLTNTVILSNTASQRGGGIYIDSGHASFSEDSWVAFNTASTGSGGGIYLDEGSLTFSDGRILGNHADSGDGGGVWASFSDLYFNHASINNNTADEYGGGLVLFDANDLILRGGEVLSNTADNGGGVALFFTSTLTQTEMNLIANNQANLDGGGIYAMTATVNLEAGRVDNNTAIAGGGVYLYGSRLHQAADSQIALNHAGLGGGLYLQNSTADLLGGQIITNTTTTSGGGIYIAMTSAVELNGSKILANQSEMGAGVYIYDTGALTQTAGSLIANNEASDSGGGVYIDGGSFYLHGGVIAANTAVSRGGGVHLNNTGFFAFTGGLIVNNTALEGGGLYANDGTGILSNGEIRENTALIDGGGLYMNGALLTETAIDIHHNTASRGGGAFIAYDAEISGANIYSNTANMEGGGIYILYGNVDILDADISGNTAVMGGGAFIAVNGVAITNTSFTDNSALAGGGILAGSGARLPSDPPPSETVSLYQVQFIDNTAASDGGGLLVNYPGIFLVAHMCSFEGNTAVSGGGLQLNDGAAEVSDSYFIGNTAEKGGGIHVQGGTAQFVNLTLHGNHATVNNGGGFLGDGGATTFEFATITNNTAASGAGGLQKMPAATSVTLTNTLVASNTPQNCSPGLTSGGFNLDSGNTCGFTAPGDQVNTAPKLGPLGNNGGGTLTRALLYGSPAVDAGLCSVGVSADQRGFPRPNPNSTFCDIGAYEANTGGATDLSILKTASATSAAPGETITYTLAYTHTGPSGAVQVIIEDLIPAGFTVLEISSSGADITPIPGVLYAWDVEDLAPHSGGIITITGVLNIPLPAGAFTNTASIDCSALDPAPENNTSQAVLTILPVAPVALDNSYTTPEDTPLSIAAPGVLSNDTDGNGDALAAVLDVDAQHGTLTLNADGSFTYSPDPDYIGEDTFTYHANDGTLDSNIATVMLNIGGANDAPTAVDDDYTTVEDVPIAFSAPGVLWNDTDPDGDTLMAVLDDEPAHGTLVLGADGSLTYTPDENYYGSDSFTYHASDGTLSSNIATVTIDIAPVNDAPQTVDDQHVTSMNTSLVVAAPGVLANDSDVEGDGLTAILDTQPPTGELAFFADGSFVYTPTQDYTGTVTFNYHASDGLLDSASAQVVITITEQSADLAISMSVDQPAPAEGDTIVYTIVVTNVGPDQATGVTVNDLLPSGLSYTSDDSSGAYDPSSGKWMVGNLEIAETAVLHLTVTVNAGSGGAIITNAASVIPINQADPDPSNNTAEAAITVEESELHIYLPMVLRK